MELKSYAPLAELHRAKNRKAKNFITRTFLRLDPPLPATADSCRCDRHRDTYDSQLRHASSASCHRYGPLSNRYQQGQESREYSIPAAWTRHAMYPVLMYSPLSLHPDRKQLESPTDIYHFPIDGGTPVDHPVDLQRGHSVCRVGWAGCKRTSCSPDNSKKYLLSD